MEVKGQRIAPQKQNVLPNKDGWIGIFWTICAVFLRPAYADQGQETQVYGHENEANFEPCHWSLISARKPYHQREDGEDDPVTERRVYKSIFYFPIGKAEDYFGENQGAAESQHPDNQSHV